MERILITIVLFHFTASLNEESDGPQFTIEPQHQYARLGDRIEWECEGKFVNSEIMEAGWYSFDDTDLFEANLDSGRYNESIYEIKQADGVLLGRILTITFVRPEDFQINFTCILATTYAVKRTDIRLLSYRSDWIVDHGVAISIAVLILLFMVMFTLGVVYCLCGQEIALFFHLRFGKTVSTKGLEYDVVVLQDDSGREFSITELKPIIKQFQNLRCVFEAQVFNPGPQFEGGQYLIERSYCVVIVVTWCMENPALYGHLLKAAINLKRNIIVIEVHPDGVPINQWKLKPSQYSHTLLHYSKFLSTIRWPGDKASSRKKKEFSCEVGRRLPLVTDVSEPNYRQLLPCWRCPLTDFYNVNDTTSTQV